MATKIPFEYLSSFAKKVYSALRGYGLAVAPVEPDTPALKQRGYYRGIMLPSFKYHFSSELDGRLYFKIRIYHKDGSLMQGFSIPVTIETGEYEETEEGELRRKERRARLDLSVYLLADPILIVGFYDYVSLEPWPGLEKPIYLYFWERSGYGEYVVNVAVSNID
jgi:hypothetical protein